MGTSGLGFSGYKSRGVADQSGAVTDVMRCDRCDVCVAPRARHASLSLRSRIRPSL